MEYPYIFPKHYESFSDDCDERFKLAHDLEFVEQVLKEALESVRTKLVESKTNHALNDKLAQQYQAGVKKISTYVQVVLQFLRAQPSSQELYYDSRGVRKALSLLLYSLAEIERCLHSSAVYTSSGAIPKVVGAALLDVDDNESVLLAYRFLLRDFSFCLDMVQVAFNRFIFAKLDILENIQFGQESGHEMSKDVAREFCKSQPLSLFEWCESRCRPVLKQCFLELGQQVLQHPSVAQVVEEAAKEDIQDLCEELKDVQIDPGRSSQQTQILEERSVESCSSLPPQVDYKDVQRGTRHIGKGSYGFVFPCKWQGKNMVVKMIQLDSEEPKNQEKFEREVSILSSLKHPNAVQIFGFGYTEKNEEGFILMEQMEMDLRKIIRECDGTRQGGGSLIFPIDVSMHLMLQIVEGMCAMKERRVMHRDLKPANILVNRPDKDKRPLERFYEVKLADFGTSKQSVVSDSIFHTRRVGTVAYMAPEVMSVAQSEETKSKGYSWSADVWSFGMMCFEILTGKQPFEQLGGIPRILAAVQRGERPELNLLDPQDPLRSLVEDCWKFDPNERPDIMKVRQRLWECRIWHFFKVASPPTSCNWQPFLTNLHSSYTKSLTLPMTEHIKALKTTTRLIVLGPCHEACMALGESLESIEPAVEKIEVQLQELRKRFPNAEPNLKRVEDWLEKLEEVIDVARIKVDECNREPKENHKSSAIASSEVLKSMQPAVEDRIVGMKLQFQEWCKLGLRGSLRGVFQGMKNVKDKLHGCSRNLQENNTMIDSGDLSSDQLSKEIMAQYMKITKLSKEQETLALALINSQLRAVLQVSVEKTIGNFLKRESSTLSCSGEVAIVCVQSITMALCPVGTGSLSR